MNRPILLCMVLLAAAATPPAAAQSVDLVIVLDNSGSMRSNDPQGLARSAVERMVNAADLDSRVALITFDSTARLEMPLTPVLNVTAEDLGAALESLDYRGQWTDIPGAVERALYHLQEGGRPGSTQVILLLTDGIVDTGDTARDRDREGWLLGELAASAHDRGIRVFGIAFSDAADFRLIQALSRATGAEYMRVLAPEELPAAFEAMRSAIAAPIAAPVEPAEVPAAPAREPAPEPAPATEPDTTEAPEPTAGWQWWHSLLMVVVILGAVSGIAVFMRHRAQAAGSAFPPGAVLMDFAEVSGQARLSIPGKTAVVGRRAAGDPTSVTNIVIDKHTISRKHATIEWRDGEYWLEDHQSANGTFLDDEPVEGRVQLYDGARVRFDQFVFEFRLAEDDHTVMRGAAEGGDATLVRAGGGSTTVFNMPPSGGGAYESPEGDDIDIVLDDDEDPTGGKD